MTRAVPACVAVFRALAVLVAILPIACKRGLSAAERIELASQMSGVYTTPQGTNRVRVFADAQSMPPETTITIRIEPSGVLTADYTDPSGEPRIQRIEFHWNDDGELVRRFTPQGIGAIVPTSVAARKITESVHMDDQGLVVRASEEEVGLFLLAVPFKDHVEFEPVRLRR